MTDYTVIDKTIRVPTAVENEMTLIKDTEALLQNIGPAFDSWYSAQSDCYAVYQNATTIIADTMGPLITQAKKILNNAGVYSIDESIFAKRYLDGYIDEFSDAMQDMKEKIISVENQLEAEKRYREVRKANRGRVVGGGFGLGGALKGMATAGAMNAATGMAHSLGNAMGNIGSSVAASSKRAEVYKNAKAPLRKALINSGFKVRNGIRKALVREKGLEFKYVTISENEQAVAIINSYTQGNIPEYDKKDQILKALMLDPYIGKTYEIIWSDYGDKNGDLRKMASYFGCPLEQKIHDSAAQYGEEVFHADCEQYCHTFDKGKAAILYEKNILEALKKMERYCADRNINEDFIPKISFCRELLETADIHIRTVKGTLYNTREIADRVKADYTRFYQFCEGKDLATDDQIKAICALP